MSGSMTLEVNLILPPSMTNSRYLIIKETSWMNIESVCEVIKELPFTRDNLKIIDAPDSDSTFLTLSLLTF